jgi:hypothetical protein
MGRSQTARNGETADQGDAETGLFDDQRPSKSSHGTFEVTRQRRGQSEATSPRHHFSPIGKRRQANRLPGVTLIGNHTEIVEHLRLIQGDPQTGGFPLNPKTR